ncbi:MAG: MarR family transcriptional regulator [Clostridia bacterium]|nr:MarR family transcriptional regulator [Clostridia bacterium]
METHVGLYFKKISEKLERRANCEKEKLGVTYTQSKLLWFLKKHEGERVTLRDIERFFDCSHATVSGLVSRLEERGFVKTLKDEEDGRAKNVVSTEKAERFHERMKEGRVAAEESLLRGFSDEEKERLSEYLDRVYKNLE